MTTSTSTDIKLETLISEIETLQVEAGTDFREADEALCYSIENEHPAAHIRRLMRVKHNAKEELAWAENALNALKGIRIRTLDISRPN